MDFTTFSLVYASCLLGLILLISSFVFLISSFQRSLEKLNRFGTELLDRGQIDEAIEVFRKAKKMNIYSAVTHSNLGWALCKKNVSLQEALEEFNTAIRLEPFNAIHYFRRGQLYLTRMGDIFKSGQDFKRACEIEQMDNISDLSTKKGSSKGAPSLSNFYKVDLKTELLELNHRNHYA